MITEKKISPGQINILPATQIQIDDILLKIVDETNLQDFVDGVDHSLLKQKGTGVNTTYVATVAFGGTTFAIPDLFAEIYSDEGYFDIHYLGATGITVSNLNATSTYVYLDKNTVLQQQTTAPTRQDFVRKVFLMRIAVDTSTNTIVNFEYCNNPAGHFTNNVRDLYKYLLAAGVPFKIGLTVTGKSASLGFDVGAGSLMEFGGTGNIFDPNVNSFDAVVGQSFFLLTRTNSDAGGNTLIPKFWDNNGTITTLGSTTCVGHRVYKFSSGNIGMQYGQGNYANMTLAKAGVKLEQYVKNPIVDNGTFLGWWVIESTATATSGTLKSEFVEYVIGIQGGSSSSLSGVFLIGNNLSETLDAAALRANIGVTALLESFVKHNEVQAYSKQQYFETNAIVNSGGEFIDINLDNDQTGYIILGRNVVMNQPSNIKNGAVYVIAITQDSAGSRTVNWNSIFQFGTDGQPTLSTTGNLTDFLTFIGDNNDRLFFLGIKKGFTLYDPTPSAP